MTDATGCHAISRAWPADARLGYNLHGQAHDRHGSPRTCRSGGFGTKLVGDWRTIPRPRCPRSPPRRRPCTHAALNRHRARLHSPSTPPPSQLGPWSSLARRRLEYLAATGGQRSPAFVPVPAHGTTMTAAHRPLPPSLISLLPGFQRPNGLCFESARVSGAQSELGPLQLSAPPAGNRHALPNVLIEDRTGTDLPPQHLLPPRSSVRATAVISARSTCQTPPRRSGSVLCHGPTSA